MIQGKFKAYFIIKTCRSGHEKTDFAVLLITDFKGRDSAPGWIYRFSFCRHRKSDLFH